jgi:hypothetical protein
MRNRKLVTATLFLALATSGCSSRPRYFAATVNPPAANRIAFEQEMTVCRDLVGRGYKSNFGAAVVSVGGGTAAGFATAGASIAAVDGGLVFGTATSASSALALAMPFIGIGVGFGISRAIRSGREKKLKLALTNCLGEKGYEVEAWTPTKRPKPPRKDHSTPAVLASETIPNAQ